MTVTRAPEGHRPRRSPPRPAQSLSRRWEDATHPDGAARRPGDSGLSLSWRAFVVNAAILVAAIAAFATTPATISWPIAASEVLVLVVALAVSLVVNLLLLRRTFAPVERLTGLMRDVDPLEPGQRMPTEGDDRELVALATTFNEMLERIEDERRSSARRALRAQESERMRVARELHDGLGQSLTGIMLLVDELARSSRDGSQETLEEIREALRSGLEEVRRIARDLRPEALEDLGLLRALDALISQHSQLHRVRVTRRLPRALPPLGLEEELVIYRIAQEALTNVARHSGARHVEVEVADTGEHVRLIVRDDGRGFATTEADGGLTGMRERALLARAHLEIASEPGAGTTVCLDVPVGGSR